MSSANTANNRSSEDGRLPINLTNNVAGNHQSGERGVSAVIAGDTVIAIGKLAMDEKLGVSSANWI